MTSKNTFGCIQKNTIIALERIFPKKQQTINKKLVRHIRALPKMLFTTSRAVKLRKPS